MRRACAHRWALFPLVDELTTDTAGILYDITGDYTASYALFAGGYATAAVMLLSVQIVLSMRGKQEKEGRDERNTIGE